MRNELNEIISEIQVAKRVLITSHENPDSDALGSMLALGLGLKSLGIAVALYNKDGVPDTLHFLPNSELILSSIKEFEGEYDICFVVDCPTTDRPGSEFKEYLSGGSCSKIIIIDHHETRGDEGDLRLIDTNASSTGVLIYSILKAAGIEISTDIAQNIFATIVGDTGSFRYSNTNSETFKIASELVDAGAEPEQISQAIYENEPLKKIKLLGLVLPTLEMVSENRIASVYVDNSMYEETGTKRHDTEGIVNLPRCIGGVEVALMFRQESNDPEPSWKISLRSKGEVDVAKIAQEYGGGGHKKAAGCNIKGDITQAKKRIYDSLVEALP